MAQPIRPGGLKVVEHVIVLMQENRSFDHNFGALRGVRGYVDRLPLRLRNGKSVFHEPGRRPARALPYQPSVSGLVADGKLKLRLSNKADEAAHFAIYPYGGELPAPAHLDVMGERAESLPVSGPYELAVQGPNRFWVELAGSVDVVSGLWGLWWPR